MCAQQRLRPACAFAQTDQSICLSHIYSIRIKLLIELNLEFLSLTGGAEARLSLHLSKCHIVGNHMLRLIYDVQVLITLSSNRGSGESAHTRRLA